MDCQTAAVFSHVLCPLLFLKGNGADIDVTYKIAALQAQEVTAWNAGIGLRHLFPFSGKGDVGSLACAPVAHLGVEFSGAPDKPCGENVRMLTQKLSLNDTRLKKS